MLLFFSYAIINNSNELPASPVYPSLNIFSVKSNEKADINIFAALEKATLSLQL